MEISEYNKIVEISERRIREVSCDIIRPFMNKIEWNNRLIAITGSRGAGKTTLMLQHIKSTSFQEDEVLYVSLDNLWFEANSLLDLVDYFYKNGGRYIFIDEVHHLKKWQTIIKNIYDDYTKLHIVYSGSSLLKIDYEGADLSRRQIKYFMPGLSFREYLIFENAYIMEPISLPDLLEKHTAIAKMVVDKISVLKYFNTYLEKGYYPFYKDIYSGYDVRLTQIINQILDVDYPSIENVNYSTIQKIKKMLYILSQSCPQTPNMSVLYSQLDTDRNQGLKMLYALDKANLLSLLSSQKASLKNMARPDKIYCDNTNIMYALSQNIDEGTKRETFFLNQLKSAENNVLYPCKGDFMVNDMYLFEVGGPNKTFNQIKDIPNSFLAIDGIEIGRKNRVPLWMFGLLY